MKQYNGSISSMDDDIHHRSVYQDQSVESQTGKSALSTETTSESQLRTEIVWTNVIIYSILHLMAIYGLYLGFTEAKWQTLLFAWCVHHFSGMVGISAGAHRLWSHRSFKARLPLRVFIMIAQTTAFQTDIYKWVRDHRIHHKFTDTNADPHDARRGFFYSHVGWLLTKKHPLVIEQGKKLDFSDILEDPVVAFQRRFYGPMVLFFCFILPAVIPVWFWDESLSVAYFLPTVSRYVLTLNSTWLINSAAHILGNRPYNKYITPTDNMFVTFCTVGDGWHNYHHTFPQDYRSAELGPWQLNMTANFIDLCAWLGLVYDRRIVTKEMARKRAHRMGDGSHETERVGCGRSSQ